jgi:hypothetical protein
MEGTNMRQSLALTATLLALAWAAPASAQMCGGQTTGSTAVAPATDGGTGMCGMMRRSATATDPMASPSPQQGQRAGGCPCCSRMAMMQGGGGMGGMMGGGSPQGSAPQPAPGTPETPQTPRPQ